MKLDESTARRHLKSPQSLSVISISHCSSLDNTATADFPPSTKSVCLNFVRGNQTTFGRDIANFLFEPENSRSRSNMKSHLRPKAQSISFFSYPGNWTIFGWDYKNPLHLDVVDRYLQRMGDLKRFQTRLRRVWNRFIPPWVAGIDLPQSRCFGFFVSFTNKHK